MDHPTREMLEAGLEDIQRSPKKEGPVEMIVRRPGEDEREVLDVAELSRTEGLVGDDWHRRASSRTSVPHPDTQITIMNSRVAALVAQARDRWPLAGDQLYVDLDLSGANVPPGTRLSVGSAVIEVTAKPHTGCKKFRSRFGLDALRFIGSAEGRRLHMRGIYARVVEPGRIHVGDTVSKMSA